MTRTSTAMPGPGGFAPHPDRTEPTAFLRISQKAGCAGCASLQTDPLLPLFFTGY